MTSKEYTDDEKDEKLADMFEDVSANFLRAYRNTWLILLSQGWEEWLDPLNPPEGIELSNEPGHEGHVHTKENGAELGKSKKAKT
jgi:hypothetical protein